MSRVEATPGRAEEAEVLAAVRAGDEAAFATLAERYRRELQVHCYRMLGSVDDAEDLVQETFLRAWKARAGFEGRSLFRTWLYRIATNACLSALARSSRRVMPPDLVPGSAGYAEPVWDHEIPWLQPYPDHLLEPVAPSEAEPDAVVVSRETIELAYLAANRQPAAAAYLRFHGESEYRLMGLNVLRIEGGEIVAIDSFTPELISAFGLPPTL